MPEQKTGYMTELDSWTNQVVIAPLLDRGPQAISDVQKAIREKVLESYRNGQKAGPRRPQNKQQK